MLDPIEEVSFGKLKSMCRELRVPPPPDIMIGLKVHEGGILTFEDIQRGHSWTRLQWNILLITWMGAGSFTQDFVGPGYISGKSSTNEWLSDANSKNQPFAWGGGVTTDPRNGIAVGTDDLSFNVNQYDLLGLIAAGSSAGQLVYAINTVPVVTYSNKVWTFTMTRLLTNSSGATIVVRETGLYGNSMLQERSVLNPAVAVPNGAQLTVSYSISMDFSPID